MSDDLTYSITRTIDAPIERVWAAWTIPDQYEKWAYAKPGSVEQDVRAGGLWKATIVTPDNSEFPLTGSFLEVVENQRLVVGMDVPGQDQAVMNLDLAEADGQTVITVSQTSASVEQKQESEQGSTMLLDSLERFLASS